MPLARWWLPRRFGHITIRAALFVPPPPRPFYAAPMEELILEGLLAHSSLRHHPTLLLESASQGAALECVKPWILDGVQFRSELLTIGVPAVRRGEACP